MPLLADAGWHLNDLNGAAPSAAQMELVMANPTALSIRAEYQTGPDTESLCTMPQMAPEPSTLTLMIAAGYIMTFVIRRRHLTMHWR